MRVCHYKVSRGLEFTINDVGGSAATLTIQRASDTADFTLSYSRTHNCLIVERGVRHIPPLSPPAFISFVTGEVYEDWHECAASYRRRPS
jgi:hypothetical protein